MSHADEAVRLAREVSAYGAPSPETVLLSRVLLELRALRLELKAALEGREAARAPSEPEGIRCDPIRAADPKPSKRK